MSCKYYTVNGEKSKLFDDLYQYYNGKYKDEVNAEKEALRVWLLTKSDDFKKWFGEWELLSLKISKEDTNKALELSDNILGIYGKAFKEDISVGLISIAQQYNSGNETQATHIFGSELIKIALKYYPKVIQSTVTNVLGKRNSLGEPLFSDGFFDNGTEKKEVFNIGYFNKPDNAYAMSAEYQNNIRTNTENKDFFSFRTYDEGIFSSGKKTISVRPTKYKEGIYRMGDDYFRVKNRGLKNIKELKETPEALKNKFIGDEEIKYMHIQEFFDGKLNMYVYDITKLDEKKYPQYAMSAELVGDFTIDKGQGASFATSDTFTTYLNTIKDYITRLKQERIKKKGNLDAVQKLSAQIAEQEAILESLENNKSIRFLIEVGQQELDTIKRRTSTSDPELIDLTEAIRISKTWASLSDTVDLIKEGKEEEELEIIEEARKVQSEAAIMQSNLTNQLFEKLIVLAESNNMSFGKDKGFWLDENGQFRIKDVNSFGAKAISGAYSSNPLETLVEELNNANMFKSNEEYYSFLNEMDLKNQSLLNSKHPNGDFLIEKYNVEVVNEDTGELENIEQEGLITMYDRDFYNKYHTLREKAIRKEIKWKEFYKFEENHFTYELTEQGKMDFETYMDSIKQKFTDIDLDGNEVYDEVAIEEVRKQYDPEIFKNHLEDNNIEANSGAVWFTKTPKSNVPLNPNYIKLSDSQKEYHSWFSNQYYEAHANSIYDYRVGNLDIDELLLQFSKPKNINGVKRLKHIGQSGIDFFKNSFTVVSENTTSYKISRPLTNKPQIQVRFKPVESFIPEVGNKLNPIEVLKKFMASSLTYKQKVKIEETLNVINDIASIALKQEETNAGNLVSRNIGGLLATKSPSAVAERVEFTIRSILEGKATDASSTFKRNIEPGKRAFSLEQTFDSVNSFTRFKAMALSPISATGNLVMGMANNFVYASSGEYFNDKQLLQAMVKMKFSPFKTISSGITGGKYNGPSKDAILVAELMYRYNVLGDVTEELQYGESALSKFFVLQKGGEFMVQGMTALAQMLNTPVDFKDGSKGKTLLDLYELNENNRISFKSELLAEDSKWLDVNNVRLFFDKVKAVNDKIHGDYRHPLSGKKTVIGRMVFLFRTWLPMAVKERLGGEYDHYLLGKQKGRYRSAFGLLKLVKKNEDGKYEFQRDTALNLAKTFLRLIPFTKKYVKLSDNVSEVDRNNIDLFIRETQLLVTMIMATAMLKLSLSGDEDDDETNYLKYLYNQGERLQSELSMFYTPTSFNAILRNVIPLTNTLLETEKVVTSFANYIDDSESDVYKRGFRKGDSKLGTAIQQLMPITRSAQSTWSSFSQLYDQTNLKK